MRACSRQQRSHNDAELLLYLRRDKLQATHSANGLKTNSRSWMRG